MSKLVSIIVILIASIFFTCLNPASEDTTNNTTDTTATDTSTTNTYTGIEQDLIFDYPKTWDCNDNSSTSTLNLQLNSTLPASGSNYVIVYIRKSTQISSGTEISANLLKDLCKGMISSTLEPTYTDSGSVSVADTYSGYSYSLTSTTFQTDYTYNFKFIYFVGKDNYSYILYYCADSPYFDSYVTDMNSLISSISFTN